jgi:hypothetical protein
MAVSSFMLCQNCVRSVKHAEEDFARPCRHQDEKRHVVDDPKSDVAEETTEMDDNDDTTHDNNSFVASTPRNSSFQCEGCANQSQCTDCFVRQTITTSENSHRVHLSDEI